MSGDKSAAEDLAQDTVARALTNADKFQSGTSLEAWVFVMARRIWLNEKRAQRVRLAGGLVPVEETDLPTPGPDTDTNILAREVFTKVMALPEAQRATVLLVYVEGYSYREASEILGIPAGTVMSRLAAARKTLNAGPRRGRAETQ